jgi:hypothetical protein
MSEESEASQVEHQERVLDRFPTQSALFIRNLFLQARWLTSITTGKCRNAWGSVVAQRLMKNVHWEITPLDLIRYHAATLGFGEIRAISQEIIYVETTFWQRYKFVKRIETKRTIHLEHSVTS